MFKTMWLQAERSTGSREAFLSRLTAAFSTPDGSALTRYLDGVAVRVRRWDGCRIPGYRDRESIVEAYTHWWDDATLFSVWDNRTVLPQVTIWWDEAWLFEIVHRVNREDYLSLLEMTKNLYVIEEALSRRHVLVDMDEILALLVAAPAVCAPLTHGAALEWNGNITAALLLGLAYKHIDELASIVARHDQASPEAPEWPSFVSREVPALWMRVMETVSPTGWPLLGSVLAGAFVPKPRAHCLGESNRSAHSCAAARCTGVGTSRRCHGCLACSVSYHIRCVYGRRY